MGYSSGSNNRRWGLPVGLSVLILIIVLMGTAGAPAPAFAAKQGSCGWCHGVYQNVSTVTSSGVSTNVRKDMRGVSGWASPTESSLLPQGDNNTRGLHGIHMNYSSASYPANGINKIIKTPLIRSPYIDAGAPGATLVAGKVLGNYTAYVRVRGVCQVCHAANHPNHEGSFLQWSTTSTLTSTPDAVYDPNSGWPITKGYFLYTSAGRGVSYKNNISSMDGPRNGQCMLACHKGTSRANPSPWGNYTTAAIKLSCNACHADSSGVSGTEPALSGAHAAHLASGSHIALTNATTMSSANNGSCKNCHTDNRNEGKTTADWGPRFGAKAYPHAKDGTNVLDKNVNVSGAVSMTLTNWTGSYSNPGCANACHPRSNLISVAPFNKSITWTSQMDCNMCHYYEATPSLANNTTIKTGMLPGAHGIHITGSVACSSCHGTLPTDTAHVTSLPVSYVGVTLVAGLGYSQSSGNVATGNTGTCQNSCHLSTSSPWSTTTAANGCAGCHEYPGTAGDWTSTNGHSVRLSTNNLQTYTHLSPSSSYNAQTDQYGGPGGVTTDVNKCGLCHGGGTHMNGRVDKNPSSNIAYGYNGTSAFSIVSSATSPTMTCSNVVCHSGNTTPNWW